MPLNTFQTNAVFWGLILRSICFLPIIMFYFWRNKIIVAPSIWSRTLFLQAPWQILHCFLWLHFATTMISPFFFPQQMHSLSIVFISLLDFLEKLFFSLLLSASIGSYSSFNRKHHLLLLHHHRRQALFFYPRN